MRHGRFIFLFLIIGILILSGCLREYGSVDIIDADITSVRQDSGTRLTVTPYIQNNQDTDTGVLSIKVKVRDPETNLIVAEKDSDIGYIKSRSQVYNSVSLTVLEPGNYEIEILVFEEGIALTQFYSPVTVKAKPGPGEPADIKLTDMTLIITKFVNGASNAVVDVSPGIYNQGGDSRPLTMEVIARESPYTAHTESDELGIIRGSDRVRGNVRFILQRNREYTFTVNIVENGKTVVSSDLNEVINLNKIKYNTLMNYVFIEKGKPIPEETPSEPGFPGIIAFAGILLVYWISRIKRKGE